MIRTRLSSNSPTIYFITALQILSLLSCSPSRRGTDENISTQVANTIIPVKGVAMFGPVTGGIIKVFAITSTLGPDKEKIIATTTTNPDGTFNVDIPNPPDGPVGFWLVGGRYTEEANIGTSVQLATAEATEAIAAAGAAAAAAAAAASAGVSAANATRAAAATILSATTPLWIAVLPSLKSAAKSASIAITPISTMAYTRFIIQSRILLDNASAAAGPQLAAIAASINADISGQFGITDAVTVLPSTPTGQIPDSANGKYALLLAGLSKAAIDKGLTSAAIAGEYLRAYGVDGTLANIDANLAPALTAVTTNLAGLISRTIVLPQITVPPDFKGICIPRPTIPTIPAIPATPARDIPATPITIPAIPSFTTPAIPAVTTTIPGIPVRIPAIPGSPAIPATPAQQICFPGMGCQTIPAIPGLPAIPGTPATTIPGTPTTITTPAVPAVTVPGTPEHTIPGVPIHIPAIPGIPEIPGTPGVSCPS